MMTDDRPGWWPLEAPLLSDRPDPEEEQDDE